MKKVVVTSLATLVLSLVCTVTASAQDSGGREPASVDRVQERTGTADRVFDRIVDAVIGKDIADKIRENQREMDKVYPDPRPSPPPAERPNGTDRKN